jgi:hypothetical protein
LITGGDFYAERSSFIRTRLKNVDLGSRLPQIAGFHVLI